MAKKETLLDKAKKAGNKRKIMSRITDEEIELAIAWAKDKVTLTQVMSVMCDGKKTLANVYVFLSRALKAHINKGA